MADYLEDNTVKYVSRSLVDQLIFMPSWHKKTGAPARSNDR